MPVEPGLSGVATLVVTEADTAPAIGSGDVAALSTARVVALCEQAGMSTTAQEMPSGQTTVGAGVQLTHIAPCAIGTRVRAEATLERIEGRRLHFTVSVTDDRGLVAAGKLTRSMVARDQFLAKLDDR